MIVSRSAQAGVAYRKHSELSSIASRTIPACRRVTPSRPNREHRHAGEPQDERLVTSAGRSGRAPLPTGGLIR